MGYKVKDALEEPEAKDECHHYWIIESAKGPVSRGVCKFCGAEKEFLNSLPDLTVVKRNARLLELPELPDVELDKEQSKS